MNYEITDVAHLELDRALCYFKLYNKEEDFLNDLMEQISLIIEIPYAFQLKYKQVRIVPFNKYNYSIHYSIMNDIIFVLRIINQNQEY